MTFHKFVKRYTRVILGVLVAVFSLTLAISFSPWSRDPAQQDVVRGTLRKDGGEITANELQLAIRWARPYHVYSKLHPQEHQYMYSQARDPKERNRLLQEWFRPTADHFNEIARDLVLVLRRAEALGIRTTKEEAEKWIQEQFSQPLGTINQEALQGVLDQSGMNREQFTQFVAAMRSADRFIEEWTGGAEMPLKDIPASQTDHMVRIVYALLDPKDYQKKITVSPNDIEKYYKENAHRFRSRRRIAFDYLFAEFDAFKNRVPEPTEEQMRKYYRDHEEDFTKKPEGDGDPVPGIEEFDDVKDRILDILYRRLTEPEAQAAINNIFAVISDELGDVTDPKERAAKGLKIDFGAIVSKARAAGVNLAHGITPMISTSVGDVKIVDEKIGITVKRSNSWQTILTMDGLEDGTIHELPEATERGYVISRLQKVAESQPLRLDDRQIAKIRKLLEATEREEEIQEIAEEFGRRLQAAGLGGAMRWLSGEGYDGDVAQTGYFNWRSDGTRNLPPPVDPSLQAVVQAALRTLLPAGATLPPLDHWQVFPITLPNKGSQICCVYLEDVVDFPITDFLSSIQAARDDRRGPEQVRAWIRLRDSLRTSVDWKDTGS